MLIRFQHRRRPSKRPVKSKKKLLRFAFKVVSYKYRQNLTPEAFFFKLNPLFSTFSDFPIPTSKFILFLCPLPHALCLLSQALCPLPIQSAIRNLKSAIGRFRLPESAFCPLSSVFCLLLFSDFRIPTSAFPLPHSHFRIPTSHFRIPTSHFKNGIYSTPHRSPPWTPYMAPPDPWAYTPCETACTPAGSFFRSKSHRRRSRMVFWNPAPGCQTA